ncbi:MAG: cytochrome d ubiquinol oxidase subunit II [Rhodobiaceae bacterium]|nr:cytochrome d ubiquinol oxidase subunit II [Rhodobiaceae bacterium]MCC0048870.1 cytochrome d ubiquinol oxidase subunit II [Rhodobiaceae bacterium]
MDVNLDLTILWAFLIAFSIYAYVVLDGFDLGIGILFPAIPVGKDRDQAMNSVAPVWDGNETWLVLGGGGLFAAFPLAYAILMPAFYPPIIAMLLALVFRGVAFEFRWRDPGHRPFWDMAFTLGSLTAAFMQGVILGALLQGVTIEGRAYAGGWWDWLTPFSVMTGVSVVAGYALLGACWLIWKTTGEVHDLARRYGWYAFVATLAAIVAVSVATLFLDYGYYAKWLDTPRVFYTAQVPIVTALIAFVFFRSMKRGSDWMPFALAQALFLVTLAGLGISIYPYAVPVSVTIWEAAAPEKSQIFMLVGAGILIPVILAYTVYAYWVFRGKVSAEGYH